jgi:hypothetical protein
MATVETLERGDIYFFYRPRVEREDPGGRGDVQNLHLVLSPDGKRSYRLINVGRDKLPDPSRKGRARFWCFVEMATGKPRELVDALGPETYQTKTRGERHQPAARPAGEGVYQIVRHGDHTHLVYALELPDEPGEVQQELGIEPEASYILSVKNPDAPTPEGAGLPDRARAEYPRELSDRFRGRKFADVDPPDFLDHAGAELLLVAASADVEAELGLHLDTEDEDASSAEIFRDLHLRKTAQPTAPLFEGRWG